MDKYGDISKEHTPDYPDDGRFKAPTDEMVKQAMGGLTPVKEGEPLIFSDKVYKAKDGD